MNWIIVSNNKVYDAERALKNLKTIDWIEKANYHVGDIVYIYQSNNIKRITMKCVVTKIHVSSDEKIIDDMYWNDKKYISRQKKDLFVRIELLEYTLNEALSLERLKTIGIHITRNPQFKISDEQASRIDEYFSSNVEPLPMIENNEVYVEGSPLDIQLTQYERNPVARSKCLEIYGYDCQVCGMNFEKTYGEIGKNFIHVHHVNPIASKGSQYEIDSCKDLVPVCPNCHAMLHKKRNKNEAYTIHELKEFMDHVRKL